ncbi:hypothetical protein EZS27_036276 [termite gut metagenome]|uniref:Uncharacterized protein n=1 Tax=termite gut metagenome TaxID=433724 RepID=A0A5J4PVC9_9ZZZZ
MKTNEILTAEQIKDLQKLGVTISLEAHVSLSDMINLILSNGCLIQLEPHGNGGVFAQSGGFWCIREDVVDAVHTLLCSLIIRKEIASNVIIF